MDTLQAGDADAEHPIGTALVNDTPCLEQTSCEAVVRVRVVFVPIETCARAKGVAKLWGSLPHGEILMSLARSTYVNLTELT